MATYSSILAWRIQWTEEPGGLQSMELQSGTQLSHSTTITTTSNHHHPYKCALTYSPITLLFLLFNKYLLCICVCMLSRFSCVQLLCDPMDCNPTDSSVYRILQARTLEWVCLSPGDLPNLGIELMSPVLQAEALLCTYCMANTILCSHIHVNRLKSPHSWERGSSFLLSITFDAMTCYCVSVRQLLGFS